MIASKVLTRGLAKAKVYKTPGGLSPVKLVTGKAKLSKESLLQMLTSYLQVVENADGTASWHVNSCFMGIARKHGLLSVCYGDVNELSTSCRVGLIIFSILMASSLSTAFGSATLGTYSTCDYQCEVFPEGWPLNGAKGAGVECTYDDTPSIFDDQKEIKIEVDGSYFTTTGLFIFAINKLYDMGCGMLLGAATRKGHASHSGALVIGSVVAVVAVGAIAMAASVVYLQQSGTCPNKASSTSKSVISTGHLSRSEFADNFLYGCSVQAPLADPCDESCHEIPIGEKLRVCIIGAVIGLLIEWLAWKPIVQGAPSSSSPRIARHSTPSMENLPLRNPTRNLRRPRRAMLSSTCMRMPHDVCLCMSYVSSDLMTVPGKATERFDRVSVCVDRCVCRK